MNTASIEIETFPIVRMELKLFKFKTVAITLRPRPKITKLVEVFTSIIIAETAKSKLKKLS